MFPVAKQLFLIETFLMLRVFMSLTSKCPFIYVSRERRLVVDLLTIRRPLGGALIGLQDPGWR